MSLVVLVYHRVNDQLASEDWAVSVNSFREQMEYLAKHYEVIEHSQLMVNGELLMVSNEKPKIMITLDDGYRDNYTNAYPVLKEFNFSAIIFLITSMIGTDKKRRRYEQMPSPDMLSWEEVNEMAKSGIVFASHTCSHPHLPGLSYEEQKDEIMKSTDAICSNLEKSKCHKDIFCYPYGEYNQNTIKILKDLGIKFAFTVEPRINTCKSNLLELGRVEINGNDTIEDFKKKCDGTCLKASV